MAGPDRRQFLVKSGLALGLNTVSLKVGSLMNAFADSGKSAPTALSTLRGSESADSLTPLYNTNLSTAIGLGDEPVSLVDKFGQLKTRNAETRLELGSPAQPVEAAEWSQSLVEGYLPIVDTQVACRVRRRYLNVSWLQMFQLLGRQSHLAHRAGFQPHVQADAVAQIIQDRQSSLWIASASRPMLVSLH